MWEIGKLASEGKDRFAQRFDALACGGGDFEEVGVLERGVLEFAADLGADKFEPLGIDEVDFGEDDQAVVDAQKVADGEMFAGLGHDTFVGGDHQHHKVHTAGACDHGTDQAFVSGNIDDADVNVFCAKRSKAQVDRDTTALFFGEAIGALACERVDKAAFPVVDVSGCSEDSVLHAVVSLCAFGGCGLRIF